MPSPNDTVCLPKFGSLCSRVAKAMGLSPLAFASEKQRLWMRAAEDALKELADGGALTAGYNFIAYDERWSTAPLNLLFSSGAERYGKPSGKSVAHSLALPAGQFPPVSLRAVGASLEGRRASSFIEDFARECGSAQEARVFAVAHEFAHAWQTAHGFVHIRSAAEKCAADSPIAQEMISIIDSYGNSPPTPREERQPAYVCRILFEESVADAIGCWVLARRGASKPFKSLSNLREADQGSNGLNLNHYTSWLLSFIDARRPTLANQKFPEFMAELSSIIAARAPAIFQSFEGAASPRNPKP